MPSNSTQPVGPASRRNQVSTPAPESKSTYWPVPALVPPPEPVTPYALALTVAETVRRMYASCASLPAELNQVMP